MASTETDCIGTSLKKATRPDQVNADVAKPGFVRNFSYAIRIQESPVH